MSAMNKRVDLNILPVVGVAMALGVFLLQYGFRYKFMVRKTLGPGVFPMACLALLLIASVLILIKAFRQPRYRMISPFPAGAVNNTLVKKVADQLSRALHQPVQVLIKPGEGFFSALHCGAKAKPDGNTLTVLTGERPSRPNFLAAAKTMMRFEAVMGLLFDPDLFILSQESVQEQLDRALEELPKKKIGFTYSPQEPYLLREVLSIRSGQPIQGVFLEDTRQMLAAFERGEIDCGFCSLNEWRGLAGPDAPCLPAAVLALERMESVPDVPTLRELGLNVVSGRWMGLGCPKGTSAKRIESLHAVLSDPANLSSIRKEIKEKGLVPHILAPQTFRRMLENQASAVKEVYASANDETDDRTSLYRVLSGVAFFLGFIGVMPYIGYLPAAFLFLLGLSLILWPLKIRIKAVLLALAVSLLLSLGGYLLFSTAFNVVFP
jgi:tripartite-type tricarboxylate transporter receptor subunit TctC